MVERRWEVRIGAPVIATDGEYGHLQKLLLDPQQERIVALLVRPHGLLPSTTVVVPEALIVDASEHEVRLGISREQADALPKYLAEVEQQSENQVLVAVDHVLAPSGNRGSEVGRALSSKGLGMVENLRSISKSEYLWLRVRAGQQVLCRDGLAGRAHMMLTDSSGRVKGIVLQTGHLPFNTRKLIVPSSWIMAVDQENVYLAFYKSDLENLADYNSDVDLAAKVESALFTDDIQRNIDYEEIDATVHDGIVVLRGHVTTLVNKAQVEQIVGSVAGVLGVDNRLVVDQDLVIQVAQALRMDERTGFEQISVSADMGVITLDGQVSSQAAHEAAEEIAAGIPQVRAVINSLQAPDRAIGLEAQRYWQPCILQKVYAADMLLGMVEKVIINPRNRRVIAFVVHGTFPGAQNIHDPRLNGEDFQQERHVVIPTDAVRFESDSTVLLKEGGVEVAQYPDFNPAGYRYPPAEWQPPYPYRREEVLFEIQKSEDLTNVRKNFA